jgi:hypothetical protein
MFKNKIEVPPVINFLQNFAFCKVLLLIEVFDLFWISIYNLREKTFDLKK